MLETLRHDPVTELRLARAPVNALNMELVEALLAALNTEVKNGAKAIVLTGNTGIFSAGLDVRELMEASRNSVTVFWDRFFKLTHALLNCPVPVVAGITGHAPAGGAVLAIHCDYRIAAAGEFKLGLNEVQVGLAVPEVILQVLRHVVGARQAGHLAIRGLMLSPAEALNIGLVDEVVSPDEVCQRAVSYARQLTELPPVAMNTTRRNAKAELLAQHVSIEAVRLMTDYWFSDETQRTMRQLVASLGK
ncbi:MAG: enoyl-CoA hydratase/isomerase family protein [Gammaproteobacteria bacterium]|nr:enoyl-CoA hydratase/isomerase family protein [Gammaproteobacteria bacterium]